MERRALAALLDHRGRSGAMTTRWEGWARNWRDRSIDFAGRINVSHPSRILDVEERTGCYAILYQASATAQYVAYVGFSASLRREILTKYKSWGDRVRPPGRFPFTAVYIANSSLARSYEDDLIRYYAPPWNIRFDRQPTR